MAPLLWTDLDPKLDHGPPTVEAVQQDLARPDGDLRPAERTRPKRPRREFPPGSGCAQSLTGARARPQNAQLQENAALLDEEAAPDAQVVLELGRDAIRDRWRALQLLPRRQRVEQRRRGRHFQVELE